MDMISCPDSGRGLFSIYQLRLTPSRCIGARSMVERQERRGERGWMTKDTPIFRKSPGG